MKNHVNYLSVAVLLLTGCVDNAIPPQTLSEQLAGKSPQERQEILRTDCLNTAEKITGELAVSRRMPSQQAEIREMKELCRQMADAYLLPDKPLHVRLENACDSLLGMVERNQRNAQPIENTQEICDAMAGEQRH